MNKGSERAETNSLIWITAFILANLRGTTIWDVLKQGFQLTALPWIEILVWLVLIVLAGRSLRMGGLLDDYFQLWKKNWLLALFILIALLSLTWTVFFSGSLYRTAALLCSSLIAAYIGLRYSLQDLLNILFRFGTILLILCFVLALFLPVAGVMDWFPYDGAWRGIFWHKNQLGSITALFSLVFLTGALDSMDRRESNSILYFIFYLFSLVIIYFSKSVAGYLLGILVSFSATLVFLWLKIRQRLAAAHYYAAAGASVIMVAAVLLNLDFVLGLFHRDTSLTGRLPLWSHLIRDVFTESPWLGHGFGALWSMGSFRIATQQVVGWLSPVAIGDNGFLDILLHVGLVGFIPFLGVLIVSFVRSGTFAYRHPAVVNFFPLLFMIYVIAANISFSLFLETETFVWFIMIAILFMLTRAQPNAAPRSVPTP